MDIFLSEENDYFVKPNNFLISHYPDRDVVMMNNDIEVLHEGWLANLVDAAYSSSIVAAAGGRLLDGNGLISEAGAEIYFDGTGRNMGRGLPDNHPSVLAFRSVGFVSGCLMYMRRDAIKVVGTLDETFHPMYFEDAAWNYRAHTLGLKTIYSPWVKAIHLEGSSAGTTPGYNMKRYQEINREKFIAQFPDVEKYNR
jgi:GT2 family glycosyltransferase